MKKREKFVLSFDLDNTLINNKEGIVDSFNYALSKFDLPKLKKLQIEFMIGISLNEMFTKVSDKDPSKLSSAFREYYGKKGIYQAKLLPGIKSKLEELKKLNFTMGIITSKKQEMAIQLIKILQMEDFFDYILGETEDRKELGKLDPELKIILKKKYPEYQIIVIGDHPKDVMLSNNLNCPFIGVLTGNHSAKQLNEIKYGKVIILNSVRELNVDLIYSLI
ncbi:MAG: HAD hydrolase-like protein [Candidatus Lokiarchaeota archaeon]|nr:HAD hydrolase-like protein [Candidatus Lokiarchaeota archaeon]